MSDKPVRRFSLLTLAVVVAVLALAATLALPWIHSAVRDAQRAGARQRLIGTAMLSYESV